MKVPYKSLGAGFLVVVVAVVGACFVQFRGGFDDYVTVTVVSDRSGLVMDPGAKVRLRGVQVGTVTAVNRDAGSASLEVSLNTNQIARIPGNVTAEIKATTAFGAKYVAFNVPDRPSESRLTASSVVQSSNVTTEVNTVFENLQALMQHIDPAKLNATLTAIAEALRGRGTELGETLVAADEYLTDLNPSLPRLQSDLRSAAVVTGTYADAAPDIMALLGNATTTSDTVVAEKDKINEVLLGAIGLGDTGNAILSENEAQLENVARLLVPTTTLLDKYSPQYSCMLNGAVAALEGGQSAFGGGNTNYSLDLDVALLPGDEQYFYPENLPIIAAQGGPGGSPGCYPVITKDMYPAPYLAMNTGANLAGATEYKVNQVPVIQYLFGNVFGAADQP